MLKGNPDLREDVAATLVVVPDDGGVWSTPSCTVRKPDGTSLATPSVSVDDVSTTVSGTPTDASTFSVASATGIAVGDYLQITMTSGTEVFEVATVSGTALTTVYPLSQTPAASDAVVGLEMSISLTSTHTATRGQDYVAEFYTSAGNYEAVAFNVVRKPFEVPLSDMEIQRYLRQVYGKAYGAEKVRDLRESVRLRMRVNALRAGRYVDRFWDRASMRPAALAALQVELAEMGRVPPGLDPDEFYADAGARFSRLMGDVIHGAQAYDKDGDGSVEDEDTLARVGHVRLVR